MTIWNAQLSVVANLEADSESAALAKLRTALTRAGFEVYDGDSGDAFEAEEGTSVTELPPAEGRQRPTRCLPVLRPGTPGLPPILGI